MGSTRGEKYYFHEFLPLFTHNHEFYKTVSAHPAFCIVIQHICILETGVIVFSEIDNCYTVERLNITYNVAIDSIVLIN